MKVWKTKDKVAELIAKDPDKYLDYYYPNRNKNLAKEEEASRLAYEKFLKFDRMDRLIPKSL